MQATRGATRLPKCVCAPKYHGPVDAFFQIGMHRWSVLVLAAGLFSAAAFQHGIPANEDREHFLATATILGQEPIAKGLTKSKKAILTDGHITHAAQIQTVDIYMPLFKGVDGSEQREFKDSWKFNVAAYRLAKLLHLTDMVPVSVERMVDGNPAAVTWWVDDVLMDERERVAKDIQPPDLYRWAEQTDIVRIFDQLIYNMDRSRDNLLISADWSVWMIDHTRAFRPWPTLRNPEMVTLCTPEFFRTLTALTRADVTRDLGQYLTENEINGLMARRDLILNLLTSHGLRSGMYQPEAPGVFPKTVVSRMLLRTEEVSK